MAIATQRGVSRWELNPGETGKTEHFSCFSLFHYELSGNWGW